MRVFAAKARALSRGSASGRSQPGFEFFRGFAAEKSSPAVIARRRTARIPAAEGWAPEPSLGAAPLDRERLTRLVPNTLGPSRFKGRRAAFRDWRKTLR